MEKKNNFSPAQLYVLDDLIKNGYDASALMDDRIKPRDMLIYSNLIKRGIDVSLFIAPNNTENFIKICYTAIKDGYDISCIKGKDYSIEKKKNIIRLIVDGLDLNKVDIDSVFHDDDLYYMNVYYKKHKEEYDNLFYSKSVSSITDFNENQLKFLIDVIDDGVDISQFSNPLFSEMQMTMIYNLNHAGYTDTKFHKTIYIDNDLLKKEYDEYKKSLETPFNDVKSTNELVNDFRKVLGNGLFGGGLF